MYDSISLGEEIFVEEMSQQNIPADYERVEPGKKNSAAKLKPDLKIKFNSDRLLETLMRVLALSALGFVIYILFGGVIEKSDLAYQHLGREAGITLGIFTAVSIFAILFLFSKTKIKINVENSFLHIKSLRGLNHIIPVESIAECKINIFQKAQSIKTFVVSQHYKIDLDAGMLVTFKDGKNLLIASSKTYKHSKRPAFGN